MINRIVSHYRILKELGKGAMGEVYLAEDLRLGRQVAIKFASPKADKFRFLNSARLVATLNHPNIAAVYDSGETEDRIPYIVMEFVEGETLTSYLGRQHSLKHRLELIVQIAEGLSEAHEHHIIHRDIKPDNVLINRQGVAKVLDFGLAKEIQVQSDQLSDLDETAQASRTLIGAMLGTPYFMSPEQASGNPQDADTRSDLFSLGSVLYFCLTAKLPFNGTTTQEVSGQIQFLEPVPPSQYQEDLPSELDRTTLKALAKKPEDRYQSANELIADLRAAIEDLGKPIPVHPKPPVSKEPVKSPFAKLREQIRRKPLAAAFAVLAVFGGSLGGARLLHLWPFQFRAYDPIAIAHYQEGIKALHDGTYLRAKRKFELARDADKSYPLAYARLAETQAELDDNYHAKEDLVTALQLVNSGSTLSKIDSMYLEAVTAMVNNKFEEAASFYQPIVTTLPKAQQPRAYIDLGRAYEKADKIDAAIESYKQAISLDARSPAAHLRLGILYGRQKETMEKAQAEFQQAASLYQADSNAEGQAIVEYWQGFMFDSFGRTEEALASLGRALNLATTLDNQYLEILTRFHRSGIYADQGKMMEATSEMDRAIQLTQKHGLGQMSARGYFNLGYIYYRQTKYQEAESFFKRSLDTAALYKAQFLQELSRLNLGGIHIRLNQQDIGIQETQTAVKWLEDNRYPREAAPGMRLLIRDKRNRGEIAAAKELCERMLVLAGQRNDPGLKADQQVEFGRVLFYQGKFADAANQFRQALTYYDTSSQTMNDAFVARVQLARALWRIGDDKGAVAEQQKAESLLANPAVNSNRSNDMRQLLKAEIAFNQGDASSAVKALARIQSSDKYLAVQAKSLACAAQSLSGTRRAIPGVCDQAVKESRNQGDVFLQAEAHLAFSLTALQTNNLSLATEHASQARKDFAQLDNAEGQWRAAAIEAHVSQKSNKASSAGQPDNQAVIGLLKQVQQEMGEENYSRYQLRKEIQKLLQLKQSLGNQ
ncbi:MAG: protein kinase [Acidobacteria bacterium]|nr:protein kinase [Acidobacteriota bacterium]